MTDDDALKQALAELGDMVRCRCHEAYRDRGLQDPQCQCDSMDAVRVVIARIEWLERERVLDAKLLADTQALLDKAEVVMREAADRIQQLERERDGARKANREMLLEVLSAMGQAQEAYEAQLAAEGAVATLTAQVEALMKAAKKVVTSHWQSADGTISGMYELERALAVLAEIEGGKKDE